VAEFLAKKRRFYEIYRDTFAGSEIEIQAMETDSVTSAWLSSVRINTRKAGLTIPEIQTRLKDKGIPTRRIFPPIIYFPPYLKYKTKEFPHSQELYLNGLNLPSSTMNQEEDIRYVAEVLLGIVKG
jgi:perosamine synthetase